MFSFLKFLQKFMPNTDEGVRTTTAKTEAMIAGRRHKVGNNVAYLLPKDDQEVNRLDFQHFALKTVLGSNYHAPISQGKTQTILDVGCGTGRWSIEMAKDFPAARVYGFDIEVPQFKTPPPGNCAFYGGNVMQTIPFADNMFDYVHQRLLAGAIPGAKWPFVIQELTRVTKPGGWVELLEAGDVFTNMGPVQTMLQGPWNMAMRKAGFDLSLMQNLDRMMRESGLTNVTMQKIAMPLGAWAGRSGELMSLDIYNVIKGLKGVFVDKIGMPAEEFDKVLARLPQEWAENRTTYEFYLAYAQRPA